MFAIQYRKPVAFTMSPPHLHKHHHPIVHHHVSINQVTPTLFLGDIASSYSISALIRHSITAVVSLGLTPSPEWSRPANQKLIPDQNHLFIRCDDSPTQDLLCYFEEICDFIDKHTAKPDLMRILEQADEDAVSMGCNTRGSSRMVEAAQQGHVLVHCTQGVSRSPTVVVAYLMKKTGRCMDEVLREVRAQRREVEPSENFIEQLRIWERVRYSVWKDGAPKREYAEWLRRRDSRVRGEALLPDGEGDWE
ncbi:hypothetical protein OQA88_1446 [Cercophora sp. LCS_1]